MARILLADDSAPVLAQVGLSLRDAGHSVVCTDNGADTLCWLAARPAPDLLLLDLGMPGLDGHAVLRGLGPTAPPVVVISGDDVTEAEARSPAVVRVIRKPFDLRQLLAAVADALAAPRTAAPGG